MKRTSIIGLVLTAAMLLAGCGGGQTGEREIVLAPLSDIPPEIQQAPTTVQEAYRFAVANPELVSQFPCFCGCGDMGHRSNLDCYVKDTLEDGSIIFDAHAFG